LKKDTYNDKPPHREQRRQYRPFVLLLYRFFSGIFLALILPFPAFALYSCS
jgi:hypothetical protein